MLELFNSYFMRQDATSCGINESKGARNDSMIKQAATTTNIE